MGRSCYFTYEKVRDRASVADQDVMRKISDLKPGDAFEIKFKVYREYSDIEDDYCPLLTREPSNYGYETVPLDESIVYSVLNSNVEPGLEEVKGLRCINFTVRNCNSFMFNTHRLITDGTIRECEGLGINFEVEDIIVY